MDKRLKKINDRISALRQSYDQIEKTAEELLAQASEVCGGDEAYLAPLAALMRDKDAPMELRFFYAFAQFGVMRLMLNEAEREYADLLLGIDPD